MKRQLICIFFMGISIAMFAQKRSYNIGILIDERTVELDPLLLQLEEQIRTVVGEDATINFPVNSILTNNYDLEKGISNYQRLLQDGTDIILAFGVINNKIINDQVRFEKPTILFGTVNRDFNLIDLSKSKSGIENFTYLVESSSFLEDFKKFKELTDFKELGIVIEKPYADILPLKETFDGTFQSLGANYRLIPFESVSDITSNLEGIDAVYMAGGFALKEVDIQGLAKEFMSRKLPSFTANSIRDVENGIMATTQSESSLSQIMRRIGLTIESYINGATLAEMPVSIDYNPRLTINFNTAESVGVPIKYSLINDTDFVGGFKRVNAQMQYTLLDVIDRALERNLALRSVEMNVELSSQDVKTAKSNYLPNLTASANGIYTDPRLAEISNGQNPEFQTTGSLTLQQTIFSEAANANIAIQKNLQKAQQENFNAEELNTVFNASNAYFNTLILKANAQIQFRNLDLTKRNLQIAQQNFDAGESGKSDLLRFRSQMAQNTQVLVEAVNQLEQSFNALNQVLNNPIETRIDVEDVDLGDTIFKEYKYEQLIELLDDPLLREPFIDFLIEEAKVNAPELKALGYNIKASERNIRLNGSGRFLPTVALQGQYNDVFGRSGKGSTPPQGFSIVNDSYNVGLNVSIPILNGNRSNINRQTAIIQKEQLNINKENTEQGISVNVRNGVLNLINQVSNIELSKVSEQTAKEALELTQTAYSNGAVNIIQLIDAQNNYLNAQLARTNAVYNYLINALQIERFIGNYFLLSTKEENDKFSQRFLEFLNKRN